MSRLPLLYQAGTDPVDDVRQWIKLPALRAMVEAFGGEWPDGDLEFQVRELAMFSEIWNKRQGRSRLAVKDSELDLRMADRIVGWANELGLVDVAPPTRSHYDMAFVLGGLASGCIARVEHLRSLFESGTIQATDVALLASYRPLSDDNALDHPGQFAPEAVYEIDLMMALADRLQPRLAAWNVEAGGDPRTAPRQAWLVANRPGEPRIHAFGAASSAPDDRAANTADTYLLAIKDREPTRGTSVLLVTTHIYAQYQHWDAIQVFKDSGADVETIGTPPRASGRSFTPSWYAQEVRSTLLSAQRLVSRCSGP